MAKKRPETQPEKICMPTNQQPPEWVTEMHEHYQKTGAFRAADLERVLGDPRDAVEINATNEFQFACLQTEK
jgi:hypothetical protein